MLYAGYLLAALGAWQKQMWLIFVGYGMFAGIGLGCGYITPVSPLQKWFPDYKGMSDVFVAVFLLPVFAYKGMSGDVSVSVFSPACVRSWSLRACLQILV